MSIAFIHNKRPGAAIVPHIHSYITKLSPPTCTERGYTTYTCKCGHTYESNYVDALGHNFSGEWHKDATGHWHICSVCGEKSEVIEHLAGAEATFDTPQTCVVCGYEIAPALHTHAYSDWETVVAATCTTAGQKRRYCPCGSIETVEIPALGHSIKQTIIDAPSCISKGKAYCWCERCNYTETKEIQFTDHIAEVVNPVPATCTEPGTSVGRKCVVCNTFLNSPQTILPLGHSFDGTYRWSITYHWQHCTRCTDTTNGTTDWHKPIYSESVNQYYCEVCHAPTDENGNALYTNY